MLALRAVTGGTPVAPSATINPINRAEMGFGGRLLHREQAAHTFFIEKSPNDSKAALGAQGLSPATKLNVAIHVSP